jgi:hypothetical protein
MYIILILYFLGGGRVKFRGCITTIFRSRTLREATQQHKQLLGHSRPWRGSNFFLRSLALYVHTEKEFSLVVVIAFCERSG